MSSNDRKEVIAFKKSTSGAIAEEVRAASNVVVYEPIAVDEHLLNKRGKRTYPSECFSLPKSSNGSAQSRSHIKPEVGGSLNRLTYCNWSENIAEGQLGNELLASHLKCVAPD